MKCKNCGHEIEKIEMNEDFEYFLSADLSAHAGKWVWIKGGKVRASGTIEDIAYSARKYGGLLVFVPEKDVG